MLASELNSAIIYSWAQDVFLVIQGAQNSGRACLVEDMYAKSIEELQLKQCLLGSGGQGRWQAVGMRSCCACRLEALEQHAA